jgi:DNA-binding transcriptional regulator LsrR (DeoR family)
LEASDHNRLLVKLSRLYYEDELTQSEIAERLRLSRQKVQRLLREARSEGIVQIGIRPITGIFSDLEKGLEECYGLREAVVVETTSYNQEATVVREVGAGAAEYLLRVVHSEDRIVISWGASLLNMVEALSMKPQIDVQNVRVIQGLGGLGDPNNDMHAAELTRRLAKVLRGEAFILPAPGAAASRAARDAFYNDQQTASGLLKARTANLAFMGIGAPRPESILIREGRIVTWPELAELIERGAVGDMNFRYFDGRGQPIASDLDARTIGLSLEEIKQTGHVVGVAGGAAKYKAIRGALAGQLLDVLITDHVTAQQLLKAKDKPVSSVKVEAEA